MGFSGEGPDRCTSAKLQVLGLQTRATPQSSWQDHVAGGWAWSLQGLRWGLRGLWKAGRGSQYLTGSEFPDCASGNPQFPTGYHGRWHRGHDGSLVHGSGWWLRGSSFLMGISVCSFLHGEVAKLNKAFMGEDRRMRGGLNLRVAGLGSSLITCVWGQ